ncbi:MAG: hypothetical protein IPL21_09040 [Saprospirales bacterium]|nr:hypothetical protein [Saprospirales bacterium]
MVTLTNVYPKNNPSQKKAKASINGFNPNSFITVKDSMQIKNFYLINISDLTINTNIKIIELKYLNIYNKIHLDSANIAFDKNTNYESFSSTFDKIIKNEHQAFLKLRGIETVKVDIFACLHSYYDSKELRDQLKIAEDAQYNEILEN